MTNNIYQGQLQAPFTANQELMDIIRGDAAKEVNYLWHLGIQVPTGTIVTINGEDVEVGKTGIYEIGNTEVTSLYFKSNISSGLIDYVIK